MSIRGQSGWFRCLPTVLIDSLTVIDSYMPVPTQWIGDLTGGCYDIASCFLARKDFERRTPE